MNDAVQYVPDPQASPNGDAQAHIDDIEAAKRTEANRQLREYAERLNTRNEWLANRLVNGAMDSLQLSPSERALVENHFDPFDADPDDLSAEGLIAWFADRWSIDLDER